MLGIHHIPFIYSECTYAINRVYGTCSAISICNKLRPVSGKLRLGRWIIETLSSSTAEAFGTKQRRITWYAAIHLVLAFRMFTGRQRLVTAIAAETGGMPNLGVGRPPFGQVDLFIAPWTNFIHAGLLTCCCPLADAVWPSDGEKRRRNGVCKFVDHLIRAEKLEFTMSNWADRCSGVRTARPLTFNI